MALTLDSPVLNADNLSANAKSVQVTERALERVRVAMEKEGISPAQGGLRLGVQGGGCSGLRCFFRAPLLLLRGGTSKEIGM